MISNNAIVPFGKYRGQPIDVLAKDDGYCDWLMQQDWFREKYRTIHTLIINNFGEPSETPEHNKLQNYILKQGVQKEIVNQLSENIFQRTKVMKVEPEVDGWDVVIEWLEYSCKLECENPDLVCPYSKVQMCDMHNVAVEVKPSIGDDYPSIIRQMKSNSKRNKNSFEHKMLVYQQYNGIGVSEEDMIEQFKMCGFVTFRVDELCNGVCI